MTAENNGKSIKDETRNDETTKLIEIVQYSDESKSNRESYKRNFNSLPLFVYATDLHTCSFIQHNPFLGMDCIPIPNNSRNQLNQSIHREAAHHNYNFYPLHNIQSDQTKSLQELQNEVGALLEFRDLVIETFPDLKHKMASISTSGSNGNTLTGITSNSSLASRREWEPGIRIKRKILHKDITSNLQSTAISNTGEMPLTSLLRSRSNSHSGKKEPKSGEGNGSVVQDSGFSTETSSSKEAHSASSTTGALQGAVTVTRIIHNETEDELLNLLDVIHRKSNKLRDEVEVLQNCTNKHNSADKNNYLISKKSDEDLSNLNKKESICLRKERDKLLDRIAEMEAETLIGRIKATKIKEQLDYLIKVKNDLEEQLKLALSQKLEFNSKNSKSSSSSSSHRDFLTSATTILYANALSNDTFSKPKNKPLSAHENVNNRYNNTSLLKTNCNDVQRTSKEHFNILHNLGHLDNLVSTPNEISKVRSTDSKKFAAILLEKNIIELQRHLLTLTVQNQALLHKLEKTSRSNVVLFNRLDKSREDIDDLKFQLEEKNIELEGTKAQLRTLVAKTECQSTFESSVLETNRSSSTTILQNSSILLAATQISPPSMKAMTPFQMIDDILHNSSSTESAHDHMERYNKALSTSNTCSSNTSQQYDTPKRISNKPSKIPLPGSKCIAPKPPSGIPKSTSTIKSLSRSTGSLNKKSLTSLYRTESSNSTSPCTTTTPTNFNIHNSSIPISTVNKSSSPHKNLNTSPMARLKRDSLKSRARNLDSLSRMHINNQNNVNTSPSASITNSNSNCNTNAHTANIVKTTANRLNKSEGRKPLGATPYQSVSTNAVGSMSRRFSTASIGRGSVNVSNNSNSSSTAIDIQHTDSDNGRVRNIRSALWGWLKI